ncbi:MAG: phytanoyl-CoA dioxygenase family protein [Gemmatimonadetes bacterium]|nr:phytanoyl-CoA dioxygenase family protein [Gemmatimonadota bacterium]
MGNQAPHPMLSEEQIEAFFEIGFVIVPDVFTPAEIEEMSAGFDRLQKMAYALSEPGIHNGSDFAIERKESGQVIIHRISWCGAAEPLLLAYGKDPRLLGMASQLLDSNEMNQLINQAHFKIPGDNVAFPWHQDSEHRGYGKSW